MRLKLISKWRIAFIVSVLLIAGGGLGIFYIGKTYQANEKIIEHCFDDFESVGKVIVTKEGWGSPVSCENE